LSFLFLSGDFIACDVGRQNILIEEFELARTNVRPLKNTLVWMNWAEN